MNFFYSFFPNYVQKNSTLFFYLDTFLFLPKKMSLVFFFFRKIELSPVVMLQIAAPTSLSAAHSNYDCCQSSSSGQRHLKWTVVSVNLSDHV